MACIWCEVLVDGSEVFHTGLSFAAVGGRRLPGHLDQSMSDWEWADGVDGECVSFIMKLCDWKFGMHVVETLFCFVRPADCACYTYFLIFWMFEASGLCFVWIRVGLLSLCVVSCSSGPKQA